MSRRRGLAKRLGWDRPDGEHPIGELLSSYGYLTSEEQARIQVHLEHCPACRDRFASFQQMDRLLQQSGWQTPDRKLRDGFYATINAEVAKNRSIWRGKFAALGRLTGQVAGLILLALVIAIVWLSLRQQVEEQTSIPGEFILQPTAPAQTPSLADIKTIPLSMTLAEPGSADILALSRDGRYLAAAKGSQVQIWTTATGRLLESLDTGEETALEMAFTSNDRFLVVRTTSGMLQRWRVAGGIHLGEDDTALSIAPDLPFAAGNTHLALAMPDNRVELWGIETGVRKTTLPIHREPLTALSFSPNDDILLAGDGSGVIHMWDLNTEGESQLIGPKQPVIGLVISQRGSQIAAAFADGRTRIWTQKDAGGTDMQTLPPSEREPLDMFFANSGDTFLRLFQDGTIELWPLGDDQPYSALTVPTLRRGKFAPLSKGLIVAGITVDGSVALWEKID